MTMAMYFHHREMWTRIETVIECYDAYPTCRHANHINDQGTCLFKVPLNITVSARERVCTVCIEFGKFDLYPVLKLEKLSVTFILAFFVCRDCIDLLSEEGVVRGKPR